ncbi:MAG: NifU domain protein [uncultured Cytophagales bacterium]|uniref:NifU domain protein n=1 Tax=uncultured Cytophagales bacterium TaxID=158755 RepID=A0A6J4LAT6_9SPHI|nr:MAG: NifU domain protein [uncultured Cytophagales bacterium]
MSTKYVNLYTEANPNPNSMKFVLNYLIVPDNTSFDFPDAGSAAGSPLATALFENFHYVKRVFFMNNFLTVTKAEEVSWEAVLGELKTFIRAYMEADQPIFTTEKIDELKHEANGEQDDEMVQRIKHLLDEYVRPAVESDGGAINFHSYNEGVVKVLLQGSCSGCPSSTLTLKAGIENLLKRMIPEVKEVVAEGV